MNLTASIQDRETYYKHNEPTSSGEIILLSAFDNGDTTIEYRSANFGDGKGDYKSIANATSPQNASATSDLNGHGREFLKITKNGLSQSHGHVISYGEEMVVNENGSQSSLQEFVNAYTVSGSLTATLQADDSVSWSGAASEKTASRVLYHSEHESTSSGYYPNAYGGWGYSEKREADFQRTASLVGNFDPNTGEFTNKLSRGGDFRVTISGRDAYGQVWDKTELELALESIFLDGSAGYPESPNPDPNGGLPPDFVYPSNPGGSVLLAAVAGHAGDSVDVALGYAEYVGATGEVLGSVLIEPYDWYLTANEIITDPTDPRSYLGIIPLVPASVSKAAKHVDEAAGALIKLKIAPKAGVRDLMQGGDLDGQLFPKEKIPALVKYLDRHDVWLTEGLQAGFDGGRRVMTLPKNPTVLNVRHELSHFLDWKKYGDDYYKLFNRFEREEMVLDRLMNNRIWDDVLNDAERNFSLLYPFTYLK